MRLIDADSLRREIPVDKYGNINTTITKFNIACEHSKVDAVPVRHGKWENTRPDAPMFGFYYCSLCGRKRTSPQDKYCPNCGARMDAERREE